MRNTHSTLLYAALLVLLGSLFVLPADGQIIAAQPTQLTKVVQMVPGAVPTSLTCLVGFSSSCVLQITNSTPGAPYSPNDPFVCAADFAATGQTVLMQDANANVGLVTGAALGSGGTKTSWSYVAAGDSYCRRFPGGVYVQAGGAGVTGSVTIKYIQ